MTRYSLLLILALQACGTSDDAPASVQRFAGPVDGTTSLVFVLLDGDHLNVYACNGEVDGVFEWFAATGDTSVTSDSGNASVDVDIGDEATGTLTLDGTAHPFTAAPSALGFGLYRGVAAENGDALEAGVILLDGTEQKGGVGARSSSTLTVSPSPAITTGQTSLLFNNVNIPLVNAASMYLR